ncbi:hypothetical protein [Geomobilimonas luticola]|uniref:HTH cro/C1-type domain-containing protein n=1 Tax=Geomobilimonas luticola TaxID=1114878 RepID=A0ABS5SEE8_9BACT|nr:hypothetical protein [Geomobilimonas luticola]MBT0653754.1 hypothetical protein [Geomobilimonas luticola]
MKWTPAAIKDFQIRHGLKAVDAADMLGITQAHFFYLIKGEREPSNILCKLLDCLDEKLIAARPEMETRNGASIERDLQEG